MTHQFCRSCVLRSAAIAVVAFLGMAAATSGQETPPPPAQADTTTPSPSPGAATPGSAPTRPRTTASASPQDLADFQIATWIAIDNRSEILVSQLAQQRAQNPQVRDFAQMMVREQGDLQNRLRQAAGTGGATAPPETRPAPPGNQAPPRTAPEPRTRPQPNASGSLGPLGPFPQFSLPPNVGPGRYEGPGTMHGMRFTRAAGSGGTGTGSEGTRGPQPGHAGTVVGVQNSGHTPGDAAEAAAVGFIGGQQTAVGAAGAQYEPRVVAVEAPPPADLGLQLAQAPPAPTPTPPSEADRAIAPPTSSSAEFPTPSAEVPSPTAPAPRPGIDLLAAKAQIGQTKDLLVQREMANKQGAEFDRAYMSSQVMGHLAMLATLRTLRNGASANLQNVLDQATQSTERHLEEARRLAMQLDQAGAAASSAVQRPANTRR